MDTRTLQDVAQEMEAHERECAVYRTSMQRTLDNLESRIKRLELLIMASTLTILSTMIGVIFKVL